MFNTTYIKRLYKSLLLLLMLLVNLPSFAQIPAVFTCDAAALYQTIKIEQNIAGVGSKGDMIFYAVDPSTGEFQFVGNLSVDDDGAGNEDVAIPSTINSIGFNPVDGFIYGINPNTVELYRISPNGFVEILGNITGPLDVDNGGKQAGVFDDNGIYYVTGGVKKLYSIDLSSNPQAGDSFESTFLLNIGKTTSDIAINPLNNLMYGWDQSGKRQLFTINLDNGDINVIGPAANTSQFSVFGALYFTAGGQLIGYGDDTQTGPSGNSQETLVQIDINTGVPTIITTSESVGTNDGASCPYGFELLKDAPDNVDVGDEFAYTFTIFNASGVPLTGLNFIDNLVPGVIFTSDPFDITNGLNIVGNTDGLTDADLTINNVPIGISTFKINVRTDCSLENMVLSNQASLSSDEISVVSDDPDSAGITNTTVTDITEPTVNFPSPIILEGCDISVVTEEAVAFPLSFSESDDIKDIFDDAEGYSTTTPANIESLTYTDAMVDEDACPIVINRSFKLMSTCGNEFILIQEINVADSQDPVFNETDLPANLTFDCDGEIPEPEILTASDNCAEVEVVFTETRTVGDCPTNESIERTWTATDECGNSAIHTQIISIEDNTAPVAPDAPDNEVFEDITPEDIAPVTLTAIDNCSGEINAVSVDSVDDSDPDNIIITRTWTFTDDCDNTTEISQTITIIAQNESFLCDGRVFYQTIRITQNIPDVGSAGDFILYLVNPEGEFSFFANLSVDDDGDGPEDVALENTINAIGYNTEDGMLYGVDSTNDFLYRIMANGFIQNLGVISGPISNNSNFSGAFDNDGNYYIIGNQGNFVLIENVTDLEPGEGTESTFLFDLDVRTSDIAINPTDFKVYLWDQQDRQLKSVDIETGVVDIIGPAAGTSNYTTIGALYFTASGQLFGYGNDSTIGSGSNSQESFMQFDLETGEPTTFATGLSVTVNDGTSCAFGFELLKDAPETVDLGQTFTYTFTIANATKEILNDLEFIDNLMSGLTFASDPYNMTNNISVAGSTNGLTSANLTIGSISPGSASFQIDVVTDCSLVDMVISNQASLASEFLTVTSDDPDEAGFTNTTVTNIIDPTITLPNPLEIEGCAISALNVDTAIFPLSETISDDIKDVFNTVEGYTTTAPQNITSITYIDTIESNESCSITVNRVFTLTNTCGVITELTQEINVVDSEAPSFTVPEDIMIECDDDFTFLSLTGDVTDEADNCSTGLEAVYTDSMEVGECAAEMIVVRTWTLTDDCGNVTSQDQRITLQDSIAPTFTVPETKNIACDDDVDDLSLTGNVTDVEDNCATDLESTYSDSIEDGDETDPSFTITRTWTVTDGCNDATATQTIIVNNEQDIEVLEGEELCIDEDFSYDLFNLIETDIDEDGTWSSDSGSIVLNDNFFNPSQLMNADGSFDEDDLGLYTFTYTYEGDCSGTVSASLILNDDCIVLPCGREDVQISKAVTPNNDNVNDSFAITGVETCGFTYEVQIFNRWGAKIYENNNYQNDWAGEVSDGAIGSSGLVPTGTYYYVLNIRNSGFEPIAGPIYVSTN